MKLEPGMAYKTSTLNKIFAVLSVLFLFAVLAVFLDDYIRPWKAFQVKSMMIKKEKLENDIKIAMGEIEAGTIEEVQAKIEAGKKAAEGREDQIEKIQDELNVLNGKIHGKKLELSVYNGQVAAGTFDWEHAHAHNYPNAPKLKEKLDKNRALFIQVKQDIKNFESQKKKMTKEIDGLRSELIEAEKEEKKLLGSIDLMKKAKSQVDFLKNPIFYIRNAPFLDFLDPTIKIQQVVLQNITDDRYFQHVPKVDRCMTCHTFIDQPGYENQENPFKTHPNLELMVGANSPHPMSDYGCTACHGGEGHRVNDMTSVAHTPQDDEQMMAWVEKYNWHAPHKVPSPMLKLGDTEASCVKCHRDVERIPLATKANKGRELVEENGCYACHKIKGWDHKRKPGPALDKLVAKLDKNWVKNWIWDPFDFNPHSRMPQFFRNTNNSSPEFQQFGIAEVNAMAEALWDQSSKYKPFAKYRGGNAKKGKELIEKVGCIACHQVEGIAKSEVVGSKKAPYLTGTGSKVDSDWLVSWLKKPSHYQKDTIMPSFRLTDREANDMAAYLLSLKNKTFAEKKFAPLDGDVRDQLLLEYFTAFDTVAVGKAKIAAMSDREKTLELGHRSLGKYGCYSCHTINGYAPDRAPIGPELSGIGSKPITQFGFGHEKLAHNRDTWISAHLEDPRRWDKGSSRPYKDVLRMPQFYLKKEDIKYMTTYLLGQVTDFIPEKGKKQLDAREAKMEKGFQHIVKYNCMGCHSVDGQGGMILSAYEDDVNEGPPVLNGQGHRVHADWFHHFLGNVTPIRPWLEVRMPSFDFTNEEINEIVNYFREKSKQVVFEDVPKRVEWEPGERTAAKKLFNEFACASCHTIGFNKDEASAPNLYLAKKRLRGSWIEAWLSNPQSIMPNTVMPNFWDGGESQAPGILGGDMDKQIQALRKYLEEIGYNEFQGKMNRSSR